jgi:hypothetical protein
VEDSKVASTMKHAQLRKLYVACGVLSVQLKYGSASCLKCNSTLTIDDIDIAGSRVKLLKSTVAQKGQHHS